MSVAAVGSALIAGPLYAHWNEDAVPADEDESPTLFASAATYFAKLPVTAQSPFPFGSQTTPRRGLHALSFAWRLPMASTPWFLSKRTPRLRVRLLFQRRLSFANTECVRK